MAGVKVSQNLRAERSAMMNDTAVIALRQTGSVDDVLTETAREGAQQTRVDACPK